jgi:hypothetical protein
MLFFVLQQRIDGLDDLELRICFAVDDKLVCARFCPRDMRVGKPRKAAGVRPVIAARIGFMIPAPDWSGLMKRPTGAMMPGRTKIQSR